MSQKLSRESLYLLVETQSRFKQRTKKRKAQGGTAYVSTNVSKDETRDGEDVMYGDLNVKRKFHQAANRVVDEVCQAHCQSRHLNIHTEVDSVI